MRALLFTGVFLTLAAAAPFAHAQVGPTSQSPNSKPAVIRQPGFALPTWLPDFIISPSEKRARDACEDKLPTCRDSVRAEMDLEKQLSLFVPWLIAAAGILTVLFLLRAREKEKARQRKLARRHHDPKAFRKLDKTAEEKAEDAERQRQRDEMAL